MKTLSTLIIGMMFAIVSSANAAVPGVKAAELIHKGNAVELIHKVKSVELIPELIHQGNAVELIHQMKRGVGAVNIVAPQSSRLNNNRDLNELLGEPELNDVLGF